MSMYNEEDLAILTDAERAAILDDDGAAEANRKALEAIANGDDEEDDEDDEDDGTDTAGEAADGDNSDSAGDSEKKPTQDEAAAAVSQRREREGPFRPQYVAQVPADIDAKMGKIDADIDGLAVQFKAGDIDFEEFQRQTRDLERIRLELNNARTKAQVSQEMNAQASMQEWQFTIKGFFKSTAKNGDIDYMKDEAKRNDLDSFVKVLAQNPANEERDPEWFLEEAHRRVRALHGLTGLTQAETKVNASAKPQARKPAIDSIPKTLSQVPGSDGPGDLGDEFANIDRLSGDKLEAAIAAMSPAQRERYMNGS